MDTQHIRPENISHERWISVGIVDRTPKVAAPSRTYPATRRHRRRSSRLDRLVALSMLLVITSLIPTVFIARAQSLWHKTVTTTSYARTH